VCGEAKQSGKVIYRRGKFWRGREVRGGAPTLIKMLIARLVSGGFPAGSPRRSSAGSPRGVSIFHPLGWYAR
jgi:hypothetical protein